MGAALTATYDGTLSRVRLAATDLGILNANPYFETDAVGWGFAGGTVARSTAQFHQGAASLLLTPTGGIATSQAQADLVPCAAGTAIYAEAWVRCAVSRSINIAINWNTAGGAFISQDFATVAVTANTWTKLTLNATAPPTTGQCRLIPASLTGTPPNTHLTYIDEATIGPAAPPISATVERSVGGTRWTTVRGGAPVKVEGRTLALDDYEFVPGVVNTYRITAVSDTGAITAIAEDFEDTTLNVTVTNAGAAAWARSSVSAHSGTWSFKSGAIGHSQTSDAIVAVPAGAKTLRFWYRVSSESGWDFLQYIPSATPVLSVSGAGSWTQSPIYNVAGLTQVRFRYTKDTSDVAGEDAAYIDDLLFTGAFGAAAPVTTDVLTAAVTPVLDGVWLKSVAQPFLNRRVRVNEMGDITRPVRAGVFAVAGRSLPVAVTDVRLARRWAMKLVADTAQAADDLDLALAAGDVMFLHVPAGYPVPVPTAYISIEDVTVTGSRADWRLFDLPCVEVAAPGADVVGATVNWQTILSTYSTWADLLAGNATWADVLNRIGSPADVVVP